MQVGDMFHARHAADCAEKLLSMCVPASAILVSSSLDPLGKCNIRAVRGCVVMLVLPLFWWCNVVDFPDGLLLHVQLLDVHDLTHVILVTSLMLRSWLKSPKRVHVWVSWLMI